MDLNNKVAIITGVSKGIGLATVKALTAQGARVAGWGRTKPDFEHKNFKFYKTDVSVPESVDAAYEKTVADFGKDIAVLINNAGFGWRGNTEEMPNETWHQMFATNVNGPFYCSKKLIPQMKANDEGHVINICSVAATKGVQEMSCYAATKHALKGFSHSLFHELRNFGIKVTCVYPGSVQTDFFNNVEGVEAHQNMMRPEDISETIMHILQSHPNYLHVDWEVRPLKPKG